MTGQKARQICAKVEGYSPFYNGCLVKIIGHYQPNGDYTVKFGNGMISDIPAQYLKLVR